MLIIKFTLVDVGDYEKQSNHCLFNNYLNLPKPENLQETDVKAPFLLIGDEAYPLPPFLLKPVDILQAL